jgi:hypothetical protein
LNDRSLSLLLALRTRVPAYAFHAAAVGIGKTPRTSSIASTALDQSAVRCSGRDVGALGGRAAGVHHAVVVGFAVLGVEQLHAARLRILVEVAAPLAAVEGVWLTRIIARLFCSGTARRFCRRFALFRSGLAAMFRCRLFPPMVTRSAGNQRAAGRAARLGRSTSRIRLDPVDGAIRMDGRELDRARLGLAIVGAPPVPAVECARPTFFGAR